MNWIVFGGSLAAIVVLAGVAAWLKLGGRDVALTDPAEAMRGAEEALSGFDAVSAAVGEDFQAALVFDRGGRVAVLKAHGAKVAARDVPWRAVRSGIDGMVVETGERRFGTVLVKGVNALDVRRLAPQLTRV